MGRGGQAQARATPWQRPGAGRPTGWTSGPSSRVVSRVRCWPVRPSPRICWCSAQARPAVLAGQWPGGALLPAARRVPGTGRATGRAQRQHRPAQLGVPAPGAHPGPGYARLGPDGCLGRRLTGARCGPLPGAGQPVRPGLAERLAAGGHGADQPVAGRPGPGRSVRPGSPARPDARRTRPRPGPPPGRPSTGPRPGRGPPRSPGCRSAPGGWSRRRRSPGRRRR